MNKTSSSDRFYRFLGLGLLLCSIFLQKVSGQEFFTPTNHARHMHDVRLEILPDGYRVKSSYTHPFADIVYYFGDLHLNTAGEEIGWDSIEQSASIYYGPFYTWLPDNDLLGLSPGFSGIDWTVSKQNFNNGLGWSYMLPRHLAQQSIFPGDQNTLGEIFLTGVESNPDSLGGARNALLFKFDVTGALLWTLTQALPDSVGVTSDNEPTRDGGCIYHVFTNIYHNPVSVLHKISASGQILWADTLDYHSNHIREDGQGNIFTYAGIEIGNPQAIIEKRNISGQLLWTKKINTLFQHELNKALGLILAENGDALIIGVEFNNIGDFHQNFFARFDPAGRASAGSSQGSFHRWKMQSSRGYRGAPRARVGPVE